MLLWTLQGEPITFCEESFANHRSSTMKSFLSMAVNLQLFKQVQTAVYFCPRLTSTLLCMLQITKFGAIKKRKENKCGSFLSYFTFQVLVQKRNRFEFFLLLIICFYIYLYVNESVQRTWSTHKYKVCDRGFIQSPSNNCTLGAKRVSCLLGSDCYRWMLSLSKLSAAQSQLLVS